MTKIMLVEDDKSLREIYGVRLLAEGYDIVSAGDGEEALAMAIKERPQLIISDIMMPKISGFDLLDILRSTTETKNIRVIMMTALSSEDQRMRGEQLGADRYLVKSQVGIEDVVHIVHEVLNDQPSSQPATPPNEPAAPAPSSPASAPPIAGQMPVTPPPAIPPSPAPGSPGSSPLPPPAGFGPTTASRPPQPKPPQSRARVITPLGDPTVPSVNLNELLDKEMIKEAGLDPNFTPTVNSTAQQQAEVDEKLEDFVAAPVADSAPLDNKLPDISVNSSGEMSTTPDTAAPSDVNDAPAPETSAVPTTNPADVPIPPPSGFVVPTAPQEPSALPPSPAQTTNEQPPFDQASISPSIQPQTISTPPSRPIPPSA